MRIRAFSYKDDDYRSAVAIENAIEPDTPSSVAAWKHWDRNREPKYLFRRYVAEKGGERVAVGSYGHTSWSFQPDKYFLYVAVHPDEQKQGFGGAFYDFIVAELTSLQPEKLVSFTRENRKRSMRFLADRGFDVVMRAPVSRLHSETFDPGPFDEKTKRVRESGIDIKTLAELSQEDPDWERKTYELEWECLQDVPSTDPLTKRSFEHFKKGTLGSPSLLPDAWFVAVDGARYVGLSALWRNLSTDSLLETGLTGVVRSHRRRGIATAMKVRAIQYAQAHGNAIIETDNEENNPMFQLNLQLGFVAQPAYLDYEKQLSVPSTDG